MIPLRLRLRNFMCYHEDTPVIDFTGIQMACLSGDNGAGKSALLGAMTWALWGKARDRVPDDDLVTQGATDMEVDFEFALGLQRYRVLRKRNKKGRGSTMLNFEVWSDDTWKAITGHTVAETERKIIETLHLDYETFVNSAFLLQGRADSFTVKSPTERKELLGDILGLGIYDQLGDAARKHARDHEAERNRLIALVAALDRQIANKPFVLQDLAARSEALAVAEATLARLQTEYDTLTAQVQGLATQESELGALRARLDRDGKEAVRLRVDADSRRVRLAGYEATLADRAAIVDGYARLGAAQTQENALVAILTELRGLEREAVALERLLDTERNKLVNAIAVHNGRMADLTRRTVDRPALEQQLASLRADLARLAEIGERRQRVGQQLDEAQQAAAAVQGENSKLREEMDALKQKQQRLDAAFADASWHQSGGGHQGAPCPLCSQVMDEDAFKRVHDSYQQEGEARGKRYRANKRRHDELLAEVERIRKETGQLDNDLKPLAMTQKRESTVERDLQAALDAVQQLEKEQTALLALEARLQAGDYAADERARFQQVERRIKQLAFDQDAYDAIRRLIQDLAPFANRHADLLRAEAHHDDEQTALAATLEALQTLEARLVGDQTHATALEAALRDLPRLRRAHADSERARTHARREGQDAADLRTRAAEQLLGIEAAEAERAVHADAQEQAVAAKGLYDELIRAFGKGGVQAMLIEGVMPELEDEANTLLARMTEGRMHLQFETQRQAKSSDNVIETLDIRITDESGTARRYELFSGGEAFRINFAVRIALSKLLARRAGAQLQTLVIDEGFGTQDGQGRERLISALRSIQDDFACILVITHIQELKEEFPTRLEVTRTPTGSRVMLV